MSTTPIRPTRAMLAMILCVLTLGAFAQENLRASLFAQADEALQAANEARASILAPNNYADATEKYRDAEEKLKRGRSIESIKKDLDAAAQSWRLAVEATRLAEITLTSAIQARNDAEEANSGSFAADLWQDAEEKFSSAAGRLEDGNINAARSRAADAEVLYRNAELSAIKSNYLDETRRLIVQAKKDRVERDAPKTLAKAESLLFQAETALSQNRYDTDEPRNLARQAKYEIKHAMFLAGALKPLRSKDVTPEEFALASERPIEQIAGTLDMVAELDQGSDGPTQEIAARIELLQKDSYELGERRNQIVELETEIQKLEGQLGTQSQRLADQERQRQKVRQIESMFGPEEAQVLTQGQNVLIRPIGLVFASGSSQIETQYFGLLRQVQDAIRVLPNSIVLVEGHTDSYGGDEANLNLSKDRAEAVRAYLLANMRDLPADDVQFVGFGESRPVANNESAEGRAKNRRIDLVIRPKAAAVEAESS